MSDVKISIISFRYPIQNHNVLEILFSNNVTHTVAQSVVKDLELALNNVSMDVGVPMACTFRPEVQTHASILKTAQPLVGISFVTPNTNETF